MRINFYPESNDSTLVAASVEYQDIWNLKGHTFVKVLESETGLPLPNIVLNALVYEGISRSHPLILRASYSSDIKAAVLVHELGHRILTANGFMPEADENFHLNAHKLLYLFLYEVYAALFSEKQADAIVNWESNLRPSYRVCWQWALDLGEAKRKVRLERMKSRKKDGLPYLNGVFS